MKSIYTIIFLFLSSCSDNNDNFLHNCWDGMATCSNITYFDSNGCESPVIIGNPQSTDNYTQYELIQLDVVGVYSNNCEDDDKSDTTTDYNFSQGEEP